MTYSLIMRELTDILDQHSVAWINFSDGIYAWEVSQTDGIDSSQWVKVQLGNGWLNSFLGY